MPSGEEETVIRNGTFWQWLTYTVVFGGKPDPTSAYKILGGTRLYGGAVLLILMGASWAVGHWL